MKSKFDFIDFELKQIINHDLYRKLRFGVVKGAQITIEGKQMINLCSNDYLGLPITISSKKQNQSSSRLVSGNDRIYKTLEEKLAKHKNQQASLIYPTGYMTNLGVISTIVNKDDLILSDELNHASIIEACRLSGAKVCVYKHNDLDDLEKKYCTKFKRSFILTEGVFSMDGDLAKLNEIAKFAEKNNIITILDDAHGDFVLGKDGKGTADYFGVSKKIDVYISSLSKGLGAFGGYVASKKNVVDFCINKSKSFIYTSALPASLIDDALRRFNSSREKYRKRLERNVKLFSSSLKKIGFEIFSTSHIIPIIVGKEKTALDFGKYLFKNGVFAQPIRYPTVPKNQARIRVSITSRLSKNQIEESLSIFELVGKKFDLI